MLFHTSYGFCISVFYIFLHWLYCLQSWTYGFTQYVYNNYNISFQENVKFADFTMIYYSFLLFCALFYFCLSYFFSDYASHRVEFIGLHNISIISIIFPCKVLNLLILLRCSDCINPFHYCYALCISVCYTFPLWLQDPQSWI